MSYETIAVLMFAGMVFLMLTGQRVFAMIGAVAAASALALYGNASAELPFNAAFKLFSWHALLTLPLFVFMGHMMSKSGIAEELYQMMHVWFGKLPGGLALGTVFLMVIISAINGLSVAGLAIGSAIALPEMLRRGYDKALITGVVQGGSTLGILLPPSVVMVLFAVIARQPVSDLWLAGVFPGLIMAVIFAAYVWIRCKLNPSLAPKLSDEELAMPLVDKLKLLRAGIIPVLIFVVMIGLFVTGYTSLLESAAVGAVSAILAAAWKGRLSFALLNETARETMSVTALFMWVILGALAFSSVFDGIGAVRAIENVFINNWELSPWAVILLMQASFIVMGMFLDDTAMLVIVAPLYIPLVAQLDLGIDNQMIWFGILYTMTCQIAYISPPFGYNLFLMRGLAPKEITLIDIYKSIWPFVIMIILTIGLLMTFPQIATWLPSQFRG
ncbi:TRAP transporter large permease [Neoaquamicrobium sediminum]|jgi:tripartite ATP-independent transporter DctM subunit|uniref:TRAP transporter large permease n=1 Tax=Neoaquamicrobium sediminum TaxID=1849104 RepID=UPI0015677B19|nr:TRAP transporter large permease subunit [Mesorhizobium sediminum]NRC52510.1 TRAP transporter large permease subunit [Mesorhizobium sediminum]